MKKVILVVGIACATLMAVAQSNASQDNSGQGTSRVDKRAVATGMASGKRMHKPVTITKDTDSSSPAGVMVRESPSKASLGKTSAADDSYAKHKNSMGNAQSNPMYKDSGKSGVNPLFEGEDRTAAKPHSNVQDNGVATGDVNGDGMADRTIVKSKSNISNNRVTAGDVNGDRMPDAAASSNSTSEMKGDFSRGHQPDRKSGTSKSKTVREPSSGMATGKRQHN